MHLDSFPLSFIELLAAYWSDIGVDVEIDVVPLAPFVERRADRDFEMMKHEMAYGSLSNPASIPLRYVSTTSFNSAAVNDPFMTPCMKPPKPLPPSRSSRGW